MEQYYHDQEIVIRENVKEAVINDTKIKAIPPLKLTMVIGQIELWHSKKFITEFKQLISQAMESFGEENWYFSSPSIADNRNYIYTTNQKIKNLLKKTINCNFTEDIGETDRLWMRKEIVKKLHEIKN